MDLFNIIMTNSEESNNPFSTFSPNRPSSPITGTHWCPNEQEAALALCQLATISPSPQKPEQGYEETEDNDEMDKSPTYYLNLPPKTASSVVNAATGNNTSREQSKMYRRSRSAKPHVTNACVNCKRAHLACDRKCFHQ